MASSETCYYPNGTDVTITDFKPCPKAAGRAHSMCCATQNRAIADYCQKDGSGDYNGFCLGGGDSYLYRNSCTDRNWGPDCLNLCTNGLGIYGYSADGNMNNGDWPVTYCGDGMYCCGQKDVGTTCCTQGNGYYLVNNTGVKQKPSSSQDVQAAGLSSSAPTITTNSTGSTSRPETGVIAGSVVGGFFVGAVVAFLIFLLYHRKAMRTHSIAEADVRAYMSDPSYEKKVLAEVSAEPKAFEVAAQTVPIELSGSVPEGEKNMRKQ